MLLLNISSSEIQEVGNNVDLIDVRSKEQIMSTWRDVSCVRLI